MSVPRIVIRDWLITKLKTITKVNGYHYDVETVERKTTMLRDLNLSDCPAILLAKSATDDPKRETGGGRSGNDYFREWSPELELYLPAGGDLDIEDAGEIFLADVQRCLIENRFNGGKPSDIQFRVIPDDFARIENGVAMFVMPLTVFYDYRIGDLKP